MSSPYRIVLFSEAAGGVARHLVDLYFGLREQGKSVALIMSPNRLEDEYRRRLLDGNADVWFLPIRRSPHYGDITVIRKILGHMRSGQAPVLLHAHSTKAGLLGAALKQAVQANVYSPHAFRSVDPTLAGVSRRAIRSMERFFCKRYDRIIAVGPAELEYAKRIGLNEERLRYIPNGVTLDLYKSTPRISSLEQGRPTLGFVGRLAPQKNPLLFLEVVYRVARQFPQLRAIVVGGGPMEFEMNRRAQELHIASRMDWRGVTSAIPIFREIDVLVHTSSYEALPYTLIESAASGTAVVATRNDGSVAVLQELHDQLTDLGDADKLAAQCIKLLTDRIAMRQQKLLLERAAARFSLDNMVTQIAGEYDSVMGVTCAHKSPPVET